MDPGDGAAALLARARALGLRVGRILLTHAHLDHISNVDLVKRTFDVPIYLHAADQPLYDAVVEQGRYFGIAMRPQPPVDDRLIDEMTLDVGALSVRVRERRHSPGGVVFEIRDPEGATLSGDTLFAGSIGRTDRRRRHGAHRLDSARPAGISRRRRRPSGPLRRPPSAPSAEIPSCSNPGGPSLRVAFDLERLARHGRSPGLSARRLIRSSLTNVPFVLQVFHLRRSVVGHREPAGTARPGQPRR